MGTVDRPYRSTTVSYSLILSQESGGITGAAGGRIFKKKTRPLHAAGKSPRSLCFDSHKGKVYEEYSAPEQVT